MMKFINILNEQEEDNEITTIVIGGMPSSQYGGHYMKKMWKEEFGIDAPSNVKFLNWEDDFESYPNVNKIMGWSKGGKKLWKEINNPSYSFIGLIDPSTPQVPKSKPPDKVKLVYNPNNWSLSRYKTYRPNLDELEKNGWGTVSSSNHFKIPKEFFRKYKDQIL